MTPDDAIARAKDGRLLPVTLVLGEEEFLRGRVVRALREAAIAGGIPGLNDDQLEAGEVTVEQALGFARTLPMMARRRSVVVRGLERWEAKGETSEKRGDPFEKLMAYAAQPVPETVLLLVATKLDRRRKLVTFAKKSDFLVECETPSRRDLPRFIQAQARDLGGTLEPNVADLVAELTGPELAQVVDAVTRLCLFAGSRSVTEADVTECLVRLRPASVWELVDAVAGRNLDKALATLRDIYDPREATRLVGLLARSARQVIRFQSALAEGASAMEAAQRAGVPPFKANETNAIAKRTSMAEVETWLATLGQVDLALKGGSKRPADAVLEEAIIQICRARRPARPEAAHRRA
ncbi:MAG: DNA polymerase III subunit delta [Polyangiaceae bacterium]|nr:DNA polymerase III subunit delta [Polyangiaceae bacterium]